MLNERPSLIPTGVHAAQFSVYGLVDNPLGLAVCSFGWGSTNGQYSSVGFIFASPHYPQERDAFDIHSSDAKQLGNIYNPSFAPEVFERYQLSEETRTQAGKPQITEHEITLADTSFLGEIRYWSQPYQLSRFFFTGTETILSGFTFGPSQEELLLLLKELVVINNRNDLLEQYQHELDQESERLFGRKE